jgi:uncharacterized protein DUF5994
MSVKAGQLQVEGRVIRLGWFTSMPSGLLTAICRDNDRVDLLVIPPTTDAAAAEAAIALAADATNVLRTPQILQAADLHCIEQVDVAAHSGWESDGGHVKPAM